MASWRAGKKLSTNLTRLEVARNPVHSLGVLYSKTLRALAKMPADYPYRKYTEEVSPFSTHPLVQSSRPLSQIIQERASMVKATADLQELEAKINCGQIEEVIIQAENELDLSRKLLEVKAWEPLIEEPKANQWKWPI